MTKSPQQSIPPTVYKFILDGGTRPIFYETFMTRIIPFNQF